MQGESHKWWILANVSLGTFMATLDGSIANVALPTISGDLHVQLNLVQWVLTAYLLTNCALLPIIGKLSDLFGRTKLYQYGFLIFTLGSLLCGLSDTLGLLIASRILQALGASCLMSNSQAIVAGTFATSGRGRALGIIGTVVSLGSLTGPAIGGMLVGSFGWSSIFYINLPIGLLGFVAGMFILPKDNASRSKEPFDYLGSALFVIGIVSLLYSISNAETWGLSSAKTIGLLVLAVLLLVGFYFRESTYQHPMLDLSLYKIRLFAFGNLAALLSFVSLFCMNVMMPFYMQNVLGFSSATTGYVMMANPVAMAVVAPLSGWLSDRIGPFVLTVSGLLLNAISFGLLNTLSIRENAWTIVLHLALFGIGSGLFQSPNNSSIMGSVPRQRLGTAGGLNALVRNIGMVVGIALSVSLFSFRLHELTGKSSMVGVQASPAMITALHTVFWTAAGICIVAAILSALRNRKAPNAQATAS